MINQNKVNKELINEPVQGVGACLVIRDHQKDGKKQL